MAWYNFWRKTSTDEVVQKSYTSNELILYASSTAARYQDWNPDIAVELGLKASAIFYACVQVRAESLAQVPWVAKRRDRDGNWQAAPDSPLQKLIDKPNPDFTWSEMVELMSMHIDLAGNSYWKVIRAGNEGRPVELWPQLPKCVSIKPGKVRLIESYRWSTKDPIPANEVIHIKTANPNDLLFGMPTIQAAGRAVDIDRDSSDWQKNSLANRGVSDYAIVLDPATTPQTVERLRELHKDKQAGADNARKPMFTTRDVKPLNQNAVEMDFQASRISVWKEICSAMRVPQPMVGLLENATLANMEISRKVFWRDTIIPLLRRIQAQLQQQLAADFGPEWRIDYDTTGIEALRDDYGEKLEHAAKLWAMGVPLSKINQTLELEIQDIEELEGVDVGYISSSLLPVSMAGDMSFGQEMSQDEKAMYLKMLAYGNQSK